MSNYPNIGGNKMSFACFYTTSVSQGLERNGLANSRRCQQPWAKPVDAKPSAHEKEKARIQQPWVKPVESRAHKKEEVINQLP